ncbi:L-histidine N(alpha)-methyltransferase [Rhizorhapis sp. SPR117]|uniref:L-histidine N(alpha)-methyltransferase n=1 Tax=Rhizorhapis sp. SPR117 TaxID=2912611 RepID=UPI001F015AAC|nr:L-histidine N(alpha)-methyltransferase [Rhizorhapis sp. SPR117]
MAQYSLAKKTESSDIVVDPAFRDDILAGFTAMPKTTPARWFYDQRGSELFEDITRLPEYYPTRIETQLLETHCAQVGQIIGKGRAVVEFGAGSAAKTPHLLRQIDPAAYVPIDISGDFLRESSAVLARDFPGLPVRPVEADFLCPVQLPKELANIPRLGFFPGSTIGNFDAPAAVDLLRSLHWSLGEGAMLLIGIDRIKDASVLVPAYDDTAGVTAQFNLNLLARINRELDGTIPLDAFRHLAVWNDDRARIEMHLEAVRDVTFAIDSNRYSMRAGETIHTENSYKYGLRDARLLLRAGGWNPVNEWTDAGDMFSLFLAEAQPEKLAV